MLTNQTSEQLPGRYLVRYPGERFWQYLFVAMNTAAGHARVVAGFNRQDRGRRIWCWDEVFPGDVDHPNQGRGTTEAKR